MAEDSPQPRSPRNLDPDLEARLAAVPADKVPRTLPRPMRTVGQHLERVGKGVEALYHSTPERDGFELVKHRVPETTASTLATLGDALEAEHNEAVRLRAADVADLEEGTRLLVNMRKEIAYAVSAPDAAEARLMYRAVNRQHRKPDTRPSLAVALIAFAQLSESLRPFIEVEAPRFDWAWVEQAMAEAESLRLDVEAVGQAFERRNRLMAVLRVELGNVERAAHYLWAESYPALYRRFRWPRRRRAQPRELRPEVSVDEAVEESPPLPPVADEQPGRD